MAHRVPPTRAQAKDGGEMSLHVPIDPGQSEFCFWHGEDGRGYHSNVRQIRAVVSTGASGLRVNDCARRDDA